MFADDQAIVGGLARLNGAPCMVIGHQKGRDTKERAMQCHGTQLNPESPMRTMPEEEWRRFRATEHFVLGRGVALPECPARDLFAGM